MITMSELNPKGVALTPEMEANIKVLHFRLNEVRKHYGKPMVINSGVRSLADHKRIYAQLAKQRKLETIRVPMGSCHLRAAAADVRDSDGSLMRWCKENERFLSEIGLWMEVPDDQPRVHFQIFPPRSGDRFFKP